MDQFEKPGKQEREKLRASLRERAAEIAVKLGVNPSVLSLDNVQIDFILNNIVSQRPETLEDVKEFRDLFLKYHKPNGGDYNFAQKLDLGSHESS